MTDLPEAEFDADDWAKEDCACGHCRHQHAEGGTGVCRHTRVRKQPPPDLPDPIFAAGEEEDPLATPINWPPYEEWPEVEGPCCSGFYSAEQALADERDPS